MRWLASSHRKEQIVRFQWTGVGVGIGTALGLLFGQLIFDGRWWAALAGTAIGLVVGAVADHHAVEEKR